MKRLILIALCLACLFLGAIPSFGQSSQQCVQRWMWYGINGAPPKWATCDDLGPLAGWAMFACYDRISSCTMPGAVDEAGLGCEACKKPGGAHGGKPINFSNGNTFIVQTDVSLPGLGGGLDLTRTWNSMWPTTQLGFQVGMFGKNWTSNYEERIFLSDGLMKYGRGTGSFWTFGYSNDSQDGNSVIYKLAAPANAGHTLVSNWTNWTLTDKNGTTKVFDVNSGNLVSIADRKYDEMCRGVTSSEAGGVNAISLT